MVYICATILAVSCGTKTEFDAQGTFEATEVVVSAEANGKILNFDIEEGMTIEANKTIGTIDSLQLYLQRKQLTAQQSALLGSRPDIKKQVASLREQIAKQKSELKRVENMLRDGAATQKQYDDAKNTPLKLHLSKSSIGKINSWYVDMVVEDVIGDLAEKEGITRQTAAWLLYRGGYRIYTAMDAEIQTVLEEYYENECNFPISKSGELPQCAMIIMDQGTGNILGVAGAIGQKRGNRIQSYATDTLRPTGSVIKPLSVYAKAIDDGLIDWSTVLSDTPIIEQTDTTPAWPANANGRYLGDVTLRYSIDQSLNTVPIKLLWKIGNENAFSFLHDKLLMSSLDPDTDKGDAALALGQMTKGVTLRQTVAAYTIFENGVMSKPRSYFKVTDANGVIVLNNSPSREQVISEESAAIMTKLMQSVVENGTAKGRISLTDKCEVAGKSGTTQNSCDRYFIGYTPSLLGGVWFGYDYPKPLYEFGGNLSVTVWDEVMNEIYDKTDYKNRAASFYVPDTVQPLTYDTKTGSTDPLQIDGENSDVGWFAMN